jgi:hypothetical protein
LVDLSLPTPTIAATLSPSSSDATLYCPLWAPDDSALAVVEWTTSGASKIYVVPWGEAAPEAPLTAYESSGKLRAYGLMYH